MNEHFIRSSPEGSFARQRELRLGDGFDQLATGAYGSRGVVNGERRESHKPTSHELATLATEQARLLDFHDNVADFLSKRQNCREMTRVIHSNEK